jgi:hypothetical protein
VGIDGECKSPLRPINDSKLMVKQGNWRSATQRGAIQHGDLALVSAIPDTGVRDGFYDAYSRTLRQGLFTTLELSASAWC